MKLVDTKDLKSLPFWECQFESGRGHHKNEKKKILLQLKNYSLNDLDKLLKDNNYKSTLIMRNNLAIRELWK